MNNSTEINNINLFPMLRYFAFVSIILLYNPTLFGQITQEHTQKIDALFTNWNAPNHPGGAIGVMQDGKVVYSKAFGLASLEYLVPNTTGTLFNVASVSKQFTAMGIVLLELQGKLSVDDPVSKHLTDLPEIADKVTIRHMLHHTSGFRSLHALLGMAGWRGNDMRTNDDLYRFVKNQKELNFEPGEEYLYCNTGFMLAADIIEKVTGEEFTAWTKKEIFEPLGMYDTYVEEFPSRVIAQNATSYATTKTGFKREIDYWGYVGSGNIHATTLDLLKWGENFYNPTKDWEKAFERLQTLDNFNNGNPNNYAFGVRVDAYKGHKRISHSGSIGGFRAMFVTYPEQKLTIVVLTNFSRGNPGGNTLKISDILLPQKEEKVEARQAFPYPETKILEGIVGHYWNSQQKNTRQIILKDDSLFFATNSNNPSPLLPDNKEGFYVANSATYVNFEKDRTGKTIRMLVSNNGNVPQKYESYQEVSDADLKPVDYVGEFYSSELMTSYFLTDNAGKLQAYHNRHGDIELELIKTDVFDADYPLGTIEILRNKRGKVSGFKATNGRARNVVFEKR